MTFDFTNKKITVFGLGLSGLAVVKKLVALGSQVFVTESICENKLTREALKTLKELGVKYECGGHTRKAIKQAELIVVSPGVHLDLEILEEADASGVPIVSEIELASWLITKPIIAVTGTNGKTTTTTLIGEFLRAGGYKVAIAGNIGFPLISVDDRDLDYVVVEVSSYQLETCQTFHPWISLILNLTEDHLQRHKTMTNYAAIKGRISQRQTKKDYLVFNLDSAPVRNIARTAPAFPIPFSRKKKLPLGYYLKGNWLVSTEKHKTQRIIKAKSIKIPGNHNLENVLAAVAAARLCSVDLKAIRKTLENFNGVEHRIELSGVIRGVSYYNDSKGTNPDSTIVALDSFQNKAKAKKRVILLAGGRDKMGSLDDLCRKIKNTAKKVVLFGEARERFGEALTGKKYANLSSVSNLDEAVREAYQIAQPGDVVLLSPACASFDQYANYEERGRHFKQLVKTLKDQTKP